MTIRPIRGHYKGILIILEFLYYFENILYNPHLRLPPEILVSDNAPIVLTCQIYRPNIYWKFVFGMYDFPGITYLAAKKDRNL